MKYSNDIIGNRSRDLPVCSAVPQPTAPPRTGIALLFLDLGTRRYEWLAPRPGRYTPGKDSVPIVQEADWAPGPVWTCAKNLDPPRFDPRTVQPVASHYTD
jgi:hypothetical protein